VEVAVLPGLAVPSPKISVERRLLLLTTLLLLLTLGAVLLLLLTEPLPLAPN
jgi:hypothetical protein